MTRIGTEKSHHRASYFCSEDAIAAILSVLTCFLSFISTLPRRMQDADRYRSIRRRPCNSASSIEKPRGQCVRRASYQRCLQQSFPKTS